MNGQRKNHELTTARRWGVRAALAGVAALTALQIGAVAQRGGFGGPMQQERKLVAQFDKNGDKRLDTAERKAAREWLATQPAGGFGGRGGFERGGNATPPAPGRKMAPSDVKSYAATVLALAIALFLQFEETDRSSRRSTILMSRFP